MLSSDLDGLLKWSEKWQIKFNFEKCKIMHFGARNKGLCHEGKETRKSK